MNVDFTELKKRIAILMSHKPLPLQNICNTLFNAVPYYNWVGIYYMQDSSSTLVLGPYAGAATEHTKIPYGKGICGQVAVSGETFVVADVNAEDNYLACSIETKAEIVLPIFKDGKLIAQLDIDSHYHDPFTPQDLLFLEDLCTDLGPLLNPIA